MRKVSRFIATALAIMVLTLCGCSNAEKTATKKATDYETTYSFNGVNLTAKNSYISYKLWNITPSAWELAFYVVEFEITNNSDETVYFYGDTFELAEETHGAVYSPRFSYYGFDLYYQWVLEPSQTMTGKVAFEIPTIIPDGTPLKVRYKTKGFAMVEWELKK